MSDPLAALEAFVRRLLAPTAYHALYPAKVVAQNADGTLELVPDDPHIHGLSGVPINYGVPGVKATVAPGSRVLLGFAAGNPSKPIATVWESASVTKLTVTAGTVELGGSASLHPAVLGDVLATYLGTTLKTWLAAHVHTSTAPGSPTSPPTVLPVPDPGTLTSGTVKVKG